MLLSALLFLSVTINAQTTYYYKMTKKILNGQSSTNVSGGQFISFVDSRCYESDKDGYSVNNGVLKYEYTNSANGIILYVGNSYWGASSFLFSSDKKKLNVKVSENEVYVYQQAPAPSGQLTCSLIRNHSTSVPPAIGGELPIIVDSSIPSSSGGGTVDTPTTREQKDCPSCFGGKCTAGHGYGGMSDAKMHCNGTGRCGWCNGNGYVYVGTKTQTCSACGGSKRCKTCNGSGKCPYCGGTGYRR